MGELFNRDFSINLGGTLISSRTVDGEIKQALRVVFSIELSLGRDPNTAEVSIYNLSEKTRGLLSQKDIATVIEAGYAGRAHTIFSGKLDYGSTVREGVDWVSTFESTDGGKEIRESRINVSYKSIGIGGAIRSAAESMGLGLGNIEEKIREGNLRGALEEFTGGLVMSGQSAPQMDKLVKSLGFEWSIQDGQVILLEPSAVIDPTQAILLSPSTGLIGSPQEGDDGRVDARGLLIPELKPGRKVKIESALVNGFYRVERSVFSGDTWGQEWYTEIEAKPL
jgi:hypothetical protein